MYAMSPPLVLLLFILLLTMLNVGIVFSDNSDNNGVPRRRDNYDPTSDDYRHDMCIACQTVFDRLDTELGEKPRPRHMLRNKNNNKKGDAVIDYATSETRALEILDGDLCRMALGSTRAKCQTWVEGHEEDLIKYIRGAEHDRNARRRFCGDWCQKEWDAEKDGKSQQDL
eukprot:PhM_4_TR6735/c0_g1_i1/m.13922